MLPALAIGAGAALFLHVFMLSYREVLGHRYLHQGCVSTDYHNLRLAQNWSGLLLFVGPALAAATGFLWGFDAVERFVPAPLLLALAAGLLYFLPAWLVHHQPGRCTAHCLLEIEKIAEHEDFEATHWKEPQEVPLCSWGRLYGQDNSLLPPRTYTRAVSRTSSY